MGAWTRTLLNAHDQAVMDRERSLDAQDRPLRTEAEFMLAKRRHRELMSREKRQDILEKEAQA